MMTSTFESIRDNANRGFSMIEAMIGLAISATVMGGVGIVITMMTTADANNRIQTLVNQLYLNAVHVTENPYLFGERRTVNQDPFEINSAANANLKACLAGRGTSCRALDGTPNANFPAVVDRSMNGSFNLEGPCTENARDCLIKRTVKYAWVCTAPTTCSGLRFDINVSALAAGRLNTDLRIKERVGSVTIPARQFVSKAEIRFTCAGRGLPALYSIDYINLTDQNGCGRFEAGPACQMPMRIYAAGTGNCQPAQESDCAVVGYSRTGLYQSQATCIPPQIFVAPCANGGEAQPDGTCYYANRWCQIKTADPNSETLGFGPNNQGAQHAAGCAGDRWYQPNEVRSDAGGTFYKCLSGPYADFPVPDSRCPVTVQPCPAGQTRQPDGTCRATGGFRWAHRDKSYRKFFYGQYVVQVNNAGRLCGATRPYNPDSVLSLVPGSAADCPPMGAYFYMYENVAGMACSTVGSTCQQKVYGFNQSMRDTGTTIVNDPNVGFLDDRVEDCSDLICVDSTACPDGSPRTSDQTCPGTYGRWVSIDDGVNSGPPCPPVNRAVGNGAGGFCRPLYSRCSTFNGQAPKPGLGGICNPTDLPLPTCLADEVRGADGNCTGAASSSAGTWRLIDSFYRPGNIMNGGGPPVGPKARTYGYDCPPLPDEPEGKGCPVRGDSCYITQFANQWFRYRCQ